MKPLDIMLDNIDWKPINPDVVYSSSCTPPVATYQGILKIGDLELRVYQLSNGQRVIAEEDLVRFFEEHPQ
jgi:hypothetical protein